ncbi:MAG: VWA domain-containing protein [Bryobacteraceae bacterium]
MHRIFVVAAACLAGLVPARAQESGLTIRTTVREVVLDLVVRDSRGRQVKDLKADEVEIYEDGIPQQIRGFRLVPGREIREGLARASGAGAVAQPVNVLRAVNLTCLVFHNILGEPGKLRDALDAAQEFLSNPLQAGTYVGVFRLDAGLVTLHPFTDNREELLQAARGGFAAQPESFERVAGAIRSAIPGSSGAALPAARQTSPAARGGIAAMRGFDYRNVRDQMDQLTAMVQQFDGLPGRKTVVLFSPGILNPAQPELLQAVIDKANRALLTVYAFDLNQEDTGDLAANEINYSDSSATRTSNSQSVGTEVLRRLASSTGGAMFATRDFKKSFQRILEDVDTHYEATYHPGSDRLDAHLRKIEVRLARPGLTVQSRTGYFAVPDAGGSAALAPFETPAFTALAAEARPHAFDFQSGALRFRSDQAGSQYVIAFELPGANLTATPLPQQQKYKVHFSVLALVKDATGQVVAKVSRDFPSEISDVQLAALRANSLLYTAPIRVMHGRYTLEAAVVDHEGARSSANVFQIDSAACSGVCLSDLVLIQRVEPASGQPDAADPLQLPKGRIVPALSASLQPGAHPLVYFVVYPDPANMEKPRFSLKVVRDHQVIADQAQDLPAPDATGAIAMVIRTTPQSGNYRIKITALQGGHSVEGTLTYSIALPKQPDNTAP